MKSDAADVEHPAASALAGEQGYGASGPAGWSIWSTSNGQRAAIDGRVLKSDSLSLG